jgi:hypothetical protein
MTFSPIVSAAGSVPDSAATDPAGAAVDLAATDPAGTPLGPVAATPDPATAPYPGMSPGQPAEPTTEASHAGPAIGQADSSTGYTGSANGGYSAEQMAYSADSTTGSGQQEEAEAAWPHQTFLELGALPTAAPCARLHTTLVLWEWQLGTLVRTAGLVVSELVSNAVQASAGLTGSRFAGAWAPGTPPVRVWLSADDHRVVIQVWDGSDRPPVPQPVAPEADRGRGLLLVGALSAEWGCYTPEKSSGKVVWAVVSG